MTPNPSTPQNENETTKSRTNPLAVAGGVGFVIGVAAAGWVTKYYTRKPILLEADPEMIRALLEPVKENGAVNAIDFPKLPLNESVRIIAKQS